MHIAMVSAFVQSKGVTSSCSKKVLGAWIAGCTLFFNVPMVWAQSDAAGESAPVLNRVETQSPRFTVSGFVIEGDNPLSESLVQRILSPFKERPIDIAELRAGASEISKVLARRGYNFYRANIAPQTLRDGVVRVNIAKIDIDNVTVVGNQHFSTKNVQRSLPILRKGTSPNTQDIASALILAEDNPSKNLRVLFVKGDAPNSVNANITVQDDNPNEFHVWANNGGNRNTSRSRLGFQYHNRNVWGADHQLALSYSFSPEEPSELSQYGLNYRMPVYRLRGMANVFYSRSDAETGRVADVFDVSGAGETVGIGYTQYLKKRGTYQHRIGLNVVDKVFDSDILFGDENIGDDIRTRPLTLEYTNRWGYESFLVNSILSASTNLSGGAFNNDEAYGASRAGATSDWDRFNMTLRMDYRWNREWQARALIFGQTSSDALVAGEKFGMGGSLGDLGPRGFLEREVTVDKGAKVSLEASRAFAGGKYRLSAFYDYARGSQNNPQIGDFKSETLSSVGLGFSWRVRPDMTFNVDYGYAVDGVEPEFAQTESGGSTLDGDDRWHMSVRFFPQWPFGKKGGAL